MGEAGHLRADGDAAFVQSFDGDFVALADFAEHVGGGDAAIVEDQFTGGRGADAELVFLFADFEAGEFALDHEACDAAITEIGVGVGEEEVEAGFGGVGDPHFAAGDQEVAFGGDGASGQGKSVGACAGFRKRERGDGVFGEAGKVAALLIAVAPAEEDVVGDGVLHVGDDGGGGVDGGEGLDGEDGLEEAAALAAEFFGDLDAHEAEREHLGEDVLVEVGGIVHFADVGADALAGEFSDARLEQFFLFGEERERGRAGARSAGEAMAWLINLRPIRL